MGGPSLATLVLVFWFAEALIRFDTAKDFDLVSLADHGFHLDNRRNISFLVKVGKCTMSHIRISECFPLS